MAKKLVKKRTRKIGASPGSLIHLGEQKEERARISILEYNSEQVWERQLEAAGVEQCCSLRPEAAITWINLDGLHQIDCLETLGRCYGLHPLVMEDILNTEHRPKLEEFPQHLFILVKMLQFDEASHEIRTEQLSLILGPGHVISFQERAGDVFDGVRGRIRAGKGRVRKMGADYLA
jgi:magnesium transporter